MSLVGIDTFRFVLLFCRVWEKVIGLVCIFYFFEKRPTLQGCSIGKGSLFFLLKPQLEIDFYVLWRREPVFGIL